MREFTLADCVKMFEFQQIITSIFHFQFLPQNFEF